MDRRLKNIHAKLAREKLQGLIVTSAANISYLAKYPSRDSYLLVSKKANIYFTDSRYSEEAKKGLSADFLVRKVEVSVFSLLAQSARELGLKRIGFEERHTTFSDYRKLQQAFKGKVKLIPTAGLVELFRQIKSAEEIAKIRKAIAITSKALGLAKKLIKPGATELSIVGELERFIRRCGASNSSFGIIVAGGPNSSFPHHTSGARKIRPNEAVLVDIGVEYQGYKSDLTRVFFLSKIKVLAHKLYAIAQGAQKQAIRHIRPGIKAKDIDALGRHYIRESGYGEFFGHSLGHGVGLEVHEDPRISPKSETILKPGMVFTIEPGIYLPGQCGTRLEDMVLVTRKGCEVLSGAINQ